MTAWMWSCMLIPLKGAFGLALWCLCISIIAGFVGMCMEILDYLFGPRNY